MSALKYCVFIAFVVCLFIENGVCFANLEQHSVFYGISLVAEQKSRNVSVCFDELSQIARGTRHRERWALKLLDASGAPETKLHWGNTMWLGSQYQCKAANSIAKIPVEESPKTFKEGAESIPPFQVAYYTIYFFHNSSMQAFINFEENEFLITLGLCLPTVCREDEVYYLAEEYFETNQLTVQQLYSMKFKMESVRKIREDYSWMDATRFKVFKTITCSILLTSMLATLFGLKKKNSISTREDVSNDRNQNQTLQNGTQNGVQHVKNGGTAYELFKCFDLRENFKIFFDPCSMKNDSKLQSIFGIRSVLCAWIIVNHSIFFVSDAVSNQVYAIMVSNEKHIQVLSNAHYMVDSFLTISGFLVGYFNLYLEIEKRHQKHIQRSNWKRTHNYILTVISRFSRFTPVYLMALGFTEFIAKWRINETVFWTAHRSDLTCSQYWWRNALYINNLYPISEMCMCWSWYLSADLQCFVICFAILMLLPSSKRIVSALMGLLVVCNLYTGYLAYSTEYKPFVTNVYAYFDLLYSKPWARIGPYIVGIFAGYLLRSWDGKLQMSKLQKSIGWLLYVCVNLIIYFGFGDMDLSPLTSFFYVALSRTIWGALTSWLLIMCLTNNAGFVTAFLSSKIWVPLSRASFAVYLTHPILLSTMVSFKNSTMELALFDSMVTGLGITVLGFMVGIVFSILFESPFVRVCKILYEKTELKEHKHSINNNVSCNKEVKVQ